MERTEHQTRPRPSLQWVALAALLLLGAFDRAGALGSRLHVDDAYSWWVSSAPSAGSLLHRLAATENSPPIFYVVLTLFTRGGPAVLRIPAAVPGLALAGLWWRVLRDRIGAGAALSSALVVAVAPFLVTYSDLARGFMLSDLALVGFAWALLALIDAPTTGRWTALVVSGVLAIYTEYAAAIPIVALTMAALWIGRPARRPLLLAVTSVFVLVALWTPEIIRGQNQVGLTKLPPPYAAPSLTALRDLLVVLPFGEGGGFSSSGARWALAVAVVAVLVGAGAVLVRRGGIDIRGRSDGSDPAARTVWLLAAAAAASLVGFALAAVVGLDIFTQRYMTFEILMVAPVLVAAVGVIGGSRALLAVSGVLVIVGIVNGIGRVGAQYEPSLAPIRAAVLAAHPRTMLTDTPIVSYYLRDLHPIFDRPSGLGPGRARTCVRPCAIVDDTRTHAGTPRPLAQPFSTVLIGPYQLFIEPR